MLTLVFSFLLAMVLAVLAALIKFNKQYNLIAGYTVEAVEKDEKLKQNAHRIADSLFVMAALMIVFPILNRSEEHTSELQSRPHLVCRLLLEKKKKKKIKKT